MALRGILAAGSVMLTSDGSGMEVVAADEPIAPDGYAAKRVWVESGGMIIGTWELEPLEGTIGDAVAALAKRQALSLDDADALEVKALYGQWAPGVEYRKGDRRTYLGDLYRYIADEPSISTVEWNPADAHSLWVKVVPADPGIPQAWEQRTPGVTEGYSTGDRVMYIDGKVYESTKDDNYDVPSYPGTAWTEVPA